MEINSFHKFLASLPAEEAAYHLYGCLAQGDSGNEAWKLMEETFGENWSFDELDIPTAMLTAVMRARVAVEVQTKVETK